MLREMRKVVAQAEKFGNLEAGFEAKQYVENTKNVLIFYEEIYIMVQYENILVFQNRWKNN